jgi:hypothetical protein
MVFFAPAFDPELEHPKWYNRIADTLLAKWVLPTEWNQSNVEMMSLFKELELLASRDWKTFHSWSRVFIRSSVLCLMNNLINESVSFVVFHKRDYLPLVLLRA